MKGITLIVLAAGEGKRFSPFTTSKALVPFFGLPLFAHVVDQLPKDITNMIIVTNPQNDYIIRSFHFPIPTSTVIQQEPMGMGDAVLRCRSAINGPILIVNVDDIVDPGLFGEVLNVAKKEDLPGAIAGFKTHEYKDYGYLDIRNNTVVGIIEKPGEGKTPSPYINVVVHYIEDGPGFIAVLAQTKSARDDIYEQAMTTFLQRHPFAFVPYEGPLGTLKYPWNTLDVMDLLLTDLTSYKGKNVTIKSGVILEGPVFIEDNVKIFEHTKIVGPCYIGKNTIIGNNCIIRASHIGADCVVGYDTDITRSYIGDGCWFHSNYVGDSVLEGNVSMGGGARLANLRLDDGLIFSEVGKKKVSTGRTKFGAAIAKGVRIGINASIMPGVKIGKNSFIGAGVVLDRDIPEDSFCLLKPGYSITKNKKTAPTTRDEFKKKI